MHPNLHARCPALPLQQSTAVHRIAQCHHAPSCSGHSNGWETVVQTSACFLPSSRTTEATRVMVCATVAHLLQSTKASTPRISPVTAHKNLHLPNNLEAACIGQHEIKVRELHVPYGNERSILHKALHSAQLSSSSDPCIWIFAPSLMQLDFQSTARATKHNRSLYPHPY